jgi:Calx-beta domain-containing protein/GEVED domain-containing protein
MSWRKIANWFSLGGREAASRPATRRRAPQAQRRASSRWRRAFFEPLEDRSLLAAIITVNSAGDAIDPNDGVLTLREALSVSNGTLPLGALSSAEALQISGTPTQGVTDTIAFHIPGAAVVTISPASALPTITDPVIIDGYTQTGASANTNPAGVGLGLNSVLTIELSGTALPPVSNDALTVNADDTVIRGLIIGDFPGFGVNIMNGHKGDRVEGNFIGTDASGGVAHPNDTGVVLSSGQIGGITPAARNLISGNQRDGVSISGPGAVVQGNLIGTDITGAKPLPNGVPNDGGIVVQAFATPPAVFPAVTIGGTTPDAANVIAFNGSFGIDVGGNLTTGVQIEGNSIFQNGGLGIDINADGPTANDLNDTDKGSNNLQNFPDLSSPTVNGNAFSVQYTVDTSTLTAKYPLHIEFFKVDSDGQEGQTFLGADTYDTANAQLPKTASFALSAGAPLGGGDKIVATATDGSGNTSEFSPAIAVQAVLHTPSATNSVTYINTQSSAGLVLSPNSADTNSTKFLLIKNIAHGTLFQNDGVTPIADGSFIAVADGAAGLRFTPDAGFVGSGSFDVQSSTSNTSAGTGGGIATATINVIQPTVTVTVAATNGLTPAAALEGSADRLVYAFTRTDDPSLQLGVTFDVAGTAAFGSDYDIDVGSADTNIGGTTGTVFFAPGNSTAVVILAPLADNLVEGNETIQFTVNAQPQYVTTTPPSAASATIQDANAATVAFQDALSDAPEAGGAHTVTIILSLAAGDRMQNPTTLNISAVSGTASDADYDSASFPKQVTFPEGSQDGAAQTVTITPTTDSLVEGDETVTLGLSIGTGDETLGAQATHLVTIKDANTAKISIANSADGAEPATHGTFRVTQSLVSTTDTVVAYTVSGTATSGTDYTALSGTVMIPKGQLSADIDVAALDDSIVEGNETVVVTLTNITGGNAGISIDAAQSAATVNIADDDTAALSITANSPTTAEGAAGSTHQVTYTVKLDHAVAGGFTVAFSPSGTASGLTDYTINTTSPLSFSGSANESHDITITIQGDNTVEADETAIFTLGLVTPQSATVSAGSITTGASATTTFTNDDTATLTITANSPTTAEGAAGSSHQVTYTVKEDNAVNGGFTVAFTGSGTAAFVVDYTNNTLSPLTFSGNANESHDITLTILGDNTVEADETVILTLGAVTPAGVGAGSITTGASATTTITNDDTATLTIVANSPTTAEGASGNTHQVTYTVTSDNDVAGGFTVAFSPSGTATLNTDYTVGTTTPLTFVGFANESHDITVTIQGDDTVESDESVKLTLGLVTPQTVGVSAASIVSGASATTTIQNDDFAGISISPLNLAQTEGTGGGTKNFAFTVTLTNKADQNITVDFATADNTATSPSDYASQSGTLTFAPGQQTKQIIVLVNQDSIVEGDETFFVNLANAKFNGAADATRTSITESQATGTIQNDDTAKLTITAISSPTLEGALGSSHQVTFTVGVNNAVAGGFSVAFASSGTATLGSDYTIVGSSPLSFTGAANETHDIVITILGDNTIEPDETVTLALGTVTPAAIAGSITSGATATITIQNDDSPAGGLDFGTAPKSYGTLLADDGARHQLGSGLFLGAKVDPSADGNPAAANTGEADDDGVKLPGYIVPGLDASVTIIASKAGKLDAWVDFNRNGKFDTTERIFSSVAVAAGTNTLKFTVPVGIATSTTFARFRLSSAGGLKPTGLAADGEVEDYAVKVMTPAADSAVLIDDPANPGSKVLLITSAKNNNKVQLITSGGSILCRRGCKISTYLAANVGRIAAISSGGSDTITVPSSLKTPLQLIGKWKTIKGK